MLRSIILCLFLSLIPMLVIPLHDRHAWTLTSLMSGRLFQTLLRIFIYTPAGGPGPPRPGGPARARAQYVQWDQQIYTYIVSYIVITYSEPSCLSTAPAHALLEGAALYNGPINIRKDFL